MSNKFDGEPKDGLHVLKDEWCQKSYFGEQSQYLCEHFDEAVAATKAAAPVRTQGYALGRSTTVKIDESERERRWERAVFERWRSSGLSPVRLCWDRMIAFQIPLFDQQEKDGWGYIDLLGILGRSEICVIELKKEPATKRSGGTDSSESPLRMVLEAAAYAIALQKNWRQFREELVAHMQTLDVDASLWGSVPKELASTRLVGAAPAAYWIDWLPVTEKGSTVAPNDWLRFQNLLDKFKSVGMPVSFVSISGDIDVPGSLAGQPLPKFPLITG